jgi:hypothetical protein
LVLSSRHSGDDAREIEGMETDKSKERSEISLRALFIFVAGVGFAVSPIMKYADVSSTVMAAGLGGIGIQFMMVGRKTALAIIGSLLLIAGLTLGADAIFSAVKIQEANQKRCLRLEVDMLSPKPAIGNGADVFQALGCEAQPDAADRELRAKQIKSKRLPTENRVSPVSNGVRVATEASVIGIAFGRLDNSAV